MTKPESFIATTDYATLKNDDTDILFVTLPSSAIIPAADIITFTQDKAIGVASASIRSMINSSKDNIRYVSNTIAYSQAGGTVGGSPTNYEIYVTVHRVSDNIVRLSCFIPNPYGSTLSITGLSQTIVANVATFLPPFA